MKCSVRFIQVFSFYVGTGESTAASGGETTAVPPGKTTNNMGQEKKGH